jgi:hypothetical protein
MRVVAAEPTSGSAAHPEFARWLNVIRTNSLYETCHRLFAEYPLAVEALDRGRHVRSMILLLSDGHDSRFFTLIARTKGAASFSLLPWRADGGVDIGPDGGPLPAELAAALIRGLPVPRDGSLFGWVHEGAITALIGVQARYTPDTPVPSWAVMPLAGSPAPQWPPFTRDRLLGPWFWEYQRAGTIALLDGLLAKTSGVVFWVDTRDSLGSDCCAVAEDIRSTDGYTLRRGGYVYYEVLLGGKPVPPLAKLLDSPVKIDLAPRFQVSGQRSNGAAA